MLGMASILWVDLFLWGEGCGVSVRVMCMLVCVVACDYKGSRYV